MTASVDVEKRPWALIGLVALNLGYFVIWLDRTSGAVMGTVLGEAFGRPPRELSIYGSAYFLANLLVQLPAGIAADAFHPGRALGFSLAVSAVGTACLAHASNIAQVAISRAACGAASALYYFAAVRYLASHHAAFNRYLGLLFFAGGAGTIASSWGLSLIVRACGWRTSMGLVSFVFLVAGLPLLCSTPRTRSQNVPRLLFSDISRKVRTIPSQVANFDAFAIALWLWASGANVAFQSFSAGRVVARGCGQDLISVGLTVGVFNLGQITGCIFVGLTLDRWLDTKQVLALGGFLSSLFWFLLAFISPAGFLGLTFYWLFGLVTTGYVAGFGWAHEAASSETLGTLSSFLNLAHSAGAAAFTELHTRFAGAATAGTAADKSFIVTGASLIVCSIPVLLMRTGRRKTAKRRPRSRSSVRMTKSSP